MVNVCRNKVVREAVTHFFLKFHIVYFLALSRVNGILKAFVVPLSSAI